MRRLTSDEIDVVSAGLLDEATVENGPFAFYYAMMPWQEAAHIVATSKIASGESEGPATLQLGYVASGNDEDFSNYVSRLRDQA